MTGSTPVFMRLSKQERVRGGFDTVGEAQNQLFRLSFNPSLKVYNAAVFKFKKEIPDGIEALAFS